jgi:hypothetical protein
MLWQDYPGVNFKRSGSLNFNNGVTERLVLGGQKLASTIPQIYREKPCSPLDVITTIFRHSDSFFSTVRRKGKVSNEVMEKRESGSQKMHRFVGMIRRVSVASGIRAQPPDAA